MAALTGLFIADSYKALLKTVDNDVLGAAAKEIVDGYGNVSGVLFDTSGNVTINGNFRALDAILDSSGSAGTAGQVLTTTGTTTQWQSLSSVSGVTGSGTAGYLPLWSTNSALTNSIALQSGSTITISGTLTATTKINTPTLQLTGGVGAQGTFSWNADEETVDLIQNGATLQLGQEIQIHCKNQTGALIPDGTPVYAAGTLGASGRIKIAPMIANGTIDAKYFLGVTTEDIADGDDGKVTTFGKIRGLNTAAYTEGQTLWVSSTTAGAFQTTRPLAPNLDLEVAIVINSHANNGTIFVRSNNGHYLGTAHDVNISSVAENDLLVYKTNRWVNTKSIGDLSAANVTLSGYLRGPEVFVIDPAAFGNNTGLVQILGDLRVDGITTTINSTTISVSDKNITLAKDAVTAGDANGAGITIAGANATLTYLSATDDFTFNKNVNASRFVGPLTGDVTGNADTADALSTARNIALTGSVTGNADFDGSGDIVITTTTNHNHDDIYYTETESDDRFVNVDGDTMTGSLVINANGIGATINSAQNTGLVVSGGNNSGTITEFKFGTTKAIINTAGGGYFLGDISIGKTTAATTKLDVDGVITATGGDSDEWNLAYDYRVVGHLPLAGGTLTGDLTIQSATPSIILRDTDTSNPSNQGIRIYNEGVDANLPDGEGLMLVIDTTDTEGTDLTPSIQVAGNVYASGGNSTQWNTAYGWGDHTDAGYISDITTQTDPKYLRSDESDTMNGSLTIDANGVGLSVTSAQNTGLIVSGGNNSTIIAEYKFGTTKAIINTSGGGYFAGDVSIGKTTAAATALDVDGVITATDGNSTNWNDAYNYSTIGHLPLSGGTLSGDLIIDKANASILLYDPNTQTTNAPQIRFNTANNQGVKLLQNEFDSELPIAGYGLVLTADDDNTQFPTTGTLSFVVHGEMYAGGTTNLTTKKVWHAGDFAATNISNWNTAYGWGDHADAGYLTDITTQTDPKYLRSDESDTMTGSLTIDANGVGLSVTSAQNTGLVVSGGNNSTIIAEFKLGTTKAVINTSGGGYFAGNVSIGKTTTANTALDVDGVVTATDGDSTQWNAAYAYSQVGHLPLVGGTITGNLNVVTSNVGTTTEYSLASIEGADAHLDLISSAAGSWGSAINFVEGTNSTTNANIWSIARQTTNADGSLNFNYGILNNHNVADIKVKFSNTGIITAAGGNSTNWNTAYSYSQIGHLPLSGGTLTGNVTIQNGDLFISRTAVNGTATRKIRFAEGITTTSGFQGGYIYYNADSNVFQIGVHDAADSNVANDIPAISIDRTTANITATNITANSFVKSGGTSSQFLKADGSVDSNAYLTSSTKAADSELLDGIDSTQFLRSDESDTMDGSLTINANGVGLNITSAQNTGLIVNGGNNSAIISEFKFGTTKAVINTSGGGYFLGNVGVGLTSPTAKLHTFETNNLYDPQIIVATDVTSVLSYMGIATNKLKFYRNVSTGVDFEIQTSVVSGSSGGNIVFMPNAGNHTPTERMRLTTTGNLGIGTNAPEGLLHISSSTSGDAIVIIEADTDNNNEGDIPQLWFRGDGGINGGAILYDDNELHLVSNVSSSSAILFSVGSTNNYGLNSPTTGAVERMRIDASGNVGIGTSAPQGLTSGAYSLSLGGTNATTSGALFHQINGDFKAYAWASTSSGYTFNTIGLPYSWMVNASTKMTMLASGNVGIGTTSPISKLHANGKVTFGDAFTPVALNAENIVNIVVGGNASGQSNGIAFYEATNGFGMKIGYDGTGSGAANAIRVYNDSDNSFFTFQNGGNIGIGTDSPTQKLEVAGNVIANNLHLQLNGIIQKIGSGSTLKIKNSNGSTELSVDGSGNLGVGTLDSAALAKLHVRGTFGGAYNVMDDFGPMLVHNQSTTTNTFGIKVRLEAGNFGAAMAFYLGTTLRGYIGLTANGTLYSTSSDYRLKENVVTLENASERVMQLKPKRFNFIDGSGDVVDGFLAHEVQEVIPEAVSGDKDGIDNNGNPIYQGIDQSKLVPLLTASLQEALKRIEILEEKINNLNK